jgi:acyl transferase domain-containing protein/NADP-dependent 3-hydroxy acid dehydrogenase YdfG/acyl carrier protein
MTKKAEGVSVAIIGMGCRVAGDIEGPEQLWTALRGGRELLRPVPPGRRSSVGRQLGPARAGWISQVDEFDAAFFGVSPREAAWVDPQHRLMLEVGWEAIEHAGVSTTCPMTTETGVFVGIASHDYEHFVTAWPNPSAHGFTGSSAGFAAGRLSYALGLTGPSVCFDTGCSSSLVALHYACKSLLQGDCRMALVGGVNLILAPYSTGALSQLGALSPEGRCKTLDHRADGFARSEGALVLVLKRLEHALADRDRVWAVIRGTHVNHDGGAGQLTVPNAEAQQALIERSLERAGVRPRDVDYIEMHGTGTPVGDPIEFRALKAVFGEAARPPCVLGSVKTNIGHLEAAAGVAGVMKAALSLTHEEIPANLNFTAPNPKLEFEGTSFVVPTRNVPWPRSERSRYACVSSFGISGTNAHVVLEEPPRCGIESTPDRHAPGTLYALPISAQSPAALRQLAERWQGVFESANEQESSHLCAAAATRRSHLRHRAVVIGASREELTRGSQRLANGESHARVVVGEQLATSTPRLAFVFPGHGSQWLGMGRALAQREPRFLETLRACDDAMAQFTDWSVLDMLMDDSSRLVRGDNDVVQPVLVAVEVALARLWQARGIVPTAVVGHSMGEVAAAHIAGALSLEDAARVICQRSKVLRRVIGKGSMVLVELGMDAARRAIAGLERAISIAVNNSSSSVVLSGDTTVLQTLVADLEARDVFCRWVRVDYASHSPQMDELQLELTEQLQGVRPRAGSIPIYSTLWGETIDGSGCDGNYWIRNLREPVLFARATELLIDAGHSHFVEVSPHPLLTTSIQQVLEERAARGVAVGSLRRDQNDNEAMLESLAHLHVSGYPVDWTKDQQQPTPAIELPGYPWQRERHWTEQDQQLLAPISASSADDSNSSGAMTGAEIRLSGGNAHRYWELDVGLTAFPFLSSHRVAGTCVIPAAAYIELAVAHARLVFGDRLSGLRDMQFIKVATISEEDGIRVQVRITEGWVGSATFQIVSRRRNATDWTLHSSGTLELGARLPGEGSEVSFLSASERCGEDMSVDDLYESLAAIGLEYGPDFRSISELKRGPSAVLAKIALPPGLAAQEGCFHFHPAKLDGCLQAIAALFIASQGDQHTALPVRFQRYDIPSSCTGDLWVLASLEGERIDKDLRASIRIYDSAGSLLGRLEGLDMQRLDDTAGTSERAWLHELIWCEAEELPLPERISGKWLLLGDRRGVAQALAGRLRALGAEVVTAARSDRAAGEPHRASERHDYLLRSADPEAYRELIRKEFSDAAPCTGIVHLWSLDASISDDSTAEQVTETQLATCQSVIDLVQAVLNAGCRDRPALRLITRGAQVLASDPSPSELGPSALWGASRTLNSELPELRCTCIDLPSQADERLTDRLLVEVLTGKEDQVVLRDYARYVARIDVCDDLHTVEPTVLYTGQPYCVDLETPGTLSSLRLRARPRATLEPFEVEIAVEAAGLNFIDVMKALGAYPDPEAAKVELGWECAGRITAIGSAVRDLQLGDQVVAVAPGCLASHAKTRSSWVARLGGGLSMQQAASIPLAFATAWHSLYELARLRAGERILIHSASGGTGLAALQLAQRAGAEIFATAGRDEKREFLRRAGVAHVMDSRSLDFTREILEATGGRGVDVVLNSLSGAASDASFAALASDGRFIELGKTDIYADRPIAAKWFKRRIGVFSVDLAGLAAQRPDRFATLFQTVMREFENRRLEPLPVTSYPAQDASAALREIAQARHIGKLAVSFAQPPKEVVAGAERSALRPEACYLITGGAGAMGASLAVWLADQGAKHLWLTGRSASGERDRGLIASLAERGVAAHYVSADVASQPDVLALLREIDAAGHELRGVFHLAGILEDKIVANVDAGSLQRVFAPKFIGAWTLHRATLGRKLDYFVMYSSMAGLVGSPGQFAYNAANAAVDGLARYRRARGEAATSICWGPIAAVGLAAENSRRSESIAWRGLNAISLDDANAMLHEVLESKVAHVGVVDWNYRQYFEAMPIMTQLSSFSRLRDRSASSAKGGGRQLFRELEELPAAERAARLEAHLRGELATVLRVDATRVERTTPFASLGLDSLMGLEMRNRVEMATGLKLSATVLWTYTNITSLAAFLLREMFPGQGPANRSGKALSGLAEAQSANTLRDGGQIESLTALERELESLAGELLSARSEA